MADRTEHDEDEIEFLAPRTDLFGGDGSMAERFEMGDPDDVGVAFADVDSLPRSRTASLLAGIGLTALIAVGVIAAAPWSGEESAASPTSTSPPVTTARRATTTTVAGDSSTRPPSTPDQAAGGIDAPGSGEFSVGTGDLSPSGPGVVLARPLEGTKVIRAFDAGLDTPFDNDEVLRARLDIWAQPAAERTTGVWIAIATDAQDTSMEDLTPDASLIEVNGNPALVATDTDDVTSLSWRVGRHHRAMIESHGLSLVKLLEIAASVTIVPGETIVDPPPSDDAGIPLEHVLGEPVLDSDLRRQALRTSLRTVYYSDDHQATFVAVDSHPMRDDDPILARFLLATARTATGEAIERTIAVQGTSVVVGSLPLLPHLRAMQWQAGDDWITVLATAPIEDLIDAVRTARVAEEDEWDDLIRLSFERRAAPFDPVFSEIAAGSTPNVPQWAVRVSRPARLLLIAARPSSASIYVDPDPAKPITTYRNFDTVFVIALVDLVDLPSAKGQILRATMADGTVLTAPLVKEWSERWAGAAILIEDTTGGHIAVALADPPAATSSSPVAVSSGLTPPG